MSKINDDRIMKLKEQIKTKTEKIKNNKKFSPITNCSMEFYGNRYNINVLNKEQLIDLLVKTTALQNAAEYLKIEYNFSGYLVQDWITDIKAKYDFLCVKEEEKNLKEMEDKLTKLLSIEKKNELQLDEFEKLLGE